MGSGGDEDGAVPGPGLGLAAAAAAFLAFSTFCLFSFSARCAGGRSHVRHDTRHTRARTHTRHTPHRVLAGYLEGVEERSHGGEELVRRALGTLTERIRELLEVLLLTCVALKKWEKMNIIIKGPQIN